MGSVLENRLSRERRARRMIEKKKIGVSSFDVTFWVYL